MVYAQTLVKIIDSSGVKLVRCIHIQKKAYKHFGKVGDSFVGVIVQLKKKQSKKAFFKKGDLVRGVLIRTKKESQNNNSTGIFFKSTLQNFGVLVQKQKNNLSTVIGTRVEGFLPCLFKKKSFLYLTSLSENII